MKQIPLAIGPEPSRTFENFLPGANAARSPTCLRSRRARRRSISGDPRAAARRICCTPLVERAAAHGRRAAWFAPATPAPWTSAGDRELARHRRRARPRRRAAAGARSRSSSTPTDRGAGVVAAGAVPPVDLAVREDLRTRLGWGHVFALAPLGESEVRAALRREADRRGTFLSDEVMDYLLTRFARDLKHLMAQLDRLDEFSLADQARDHGAAPEADAGRGGRAVTPCCVGLALFDLDHTLLADRLRPRLGRVHGRARLGRRDGAFAPATTRSTPTTAPAGSTSTPTSPSPPRRCARRSADERAGGARALHARGDRADAARRRRARWSSRTARAATGVAIVTVDQRLRHRADRRGVRRSRR